MAVDEMNLNALLERLESLADLKYRDFNASLNPGMSRAIGVRLPDLRGIASELLRGDWRGFLELSREHEVFELRMLHAMVLGRCRCPIEEKLALTEAFIPSITDWAVCDTLCSDFKPRDGEMPALFEYVCACALSDEEFRKRFGLVMLMRYFHDDPWARRTLSVYRQFRHEGYYARMGAAWGLATLMLYQRDGALAILRDEVWDVFTHNKAIQKMKESYRVSDADKALVNGLRRKAERRQK